MIKIRITKYDPSLNAFTEERGFSLIMAQEECSPPRDLEIIPVHHTLI